MSTKKTEIKLTIEQKQMWRISSADTTDFSAAWQTDKPALLKDADNAEISRYKVQNQSRKWKILTVFVRTVNYVFQLLGRVKGRK